MAAGEEPPAVVVPPSESVRNRMRNTPRRDTPFEIAVRRRVHARGLRFRVDRAVAGGVSRARPDLVFAGPRVAAFLDGCFWHSCPEHRSIPQANRRFWLQKLRANAERDERHRRELEAARWRVLRFWEHEDPDLVAAAIERAVRPAGDRQLRRRKSSDPPQCAVQDSNL